MKGVARTLRLSDGAIERLARRTEAVVKATPGLRPSKAAGLGFMAEPADELLHAMQPSQWLLAQYGYHFYPPGSPPTNLNQVANPNLSPNPNPNLSPNPSPNPQP